MPVSPAYEQRSDAMSYQIIPFLHSILYELRFSARPDVALRQYRIEKQYPNKIIIFD